MNKFFQVSLFLKNSNKVPKYINLDPAEEPQMEQSHTIRIII